MGIRFQKSLAIGQIWESKIETWINQYFDADWKIEDTRDIHRDEDNDQVPDYFLYNAKTGEYCFIEAKKRNAYTIKNKKYFGFDEEFYNSYKNISKKYNCKVFVGFNDPVFDSDHMYLLDLDAEPDEKLYFNNKHGKSHAYRWNVNNLKKYKI